MKVKNTKHPQAAAGQPAETPKEIFEHITPNKTTTCTLIYTLVFVLIK